MNAKMVVAAPENMRLRTSDLDEAIEAVTRVYCPHDVVIRGPGAHGVTSTLQVLRGGVQPLVQLKYSTSVSIDAGDFPRLMLMMTCVEGSAKALQGDSKAAWHRDQTLPLSPGQVTLLDFDPRFAQLGVRLDIERLEGLCARWLNAPLDKPLRFELRPFSPKLESAWAQAVELLLRYEQAGIALPQAAASSFDEFMLSLVLAQHPHNYSEALQAPAGMLEPRIVREAEHVMRIGGLDLSVSEVAAQVGVSLRSLEAGFREWRQTTPTQYFRKLRLEAARTELRNPSSSTTVTSAAFASGFFHLARFSAYYRTQFGESPRQTLKRSRR
jgi:AraC-like DNA-binding protein